MIGSILTWSSGVPGEVRGLAHLHQNYGKLSWKTVMQGAITTARDGWNVTEDLVRYMKAGMASSLMPNFLVDDPNVGSLQANYRVD